MKKFNHLLNNTISHRNELKPSFNTGETPTQQNFHDLIDGLFSLQDNSVYKDQKYGLCIQAGTGIDANATTSTAPESPKTVLLFYDDPDELPTWTMDIENGLQIKDQQENSRFTISNNGNIGIGISNPNDRLDVKGTLRITTDQVNNPENIQLYYQLADPNETKYSNTYPDQHERALIIKPNAYQDGHGAGGAGIQFWTHGITGGSSPNYTAGHIQAMVIRKDGSVGIGTPDPGPYKLYIVGRGGNGDERGHFRFSSDALSLTWNENHPNDNVPYIEWITKAGLRQGVLGWQSNYLGLTLENGFNFGINGGNVGIGTGTPSEKLNVYNGNVRLDNGFIRFDNTPSTPSGITGYSLIFYRDSTYYNYNTGFGKSSNKDVWFNAYEGSFKFMWANNDRVTFHLRQNTSAYFVMDAHGKIASSDGLVHSSDLRFKKDIAPITSEAITKLNQLKGSTFQWRTDEFKEKNFSEGTKMGFIAQELMQVYPELVHEGIDGYYSINYSGLVPVLVEAVKDLNTKNQSLNERVLHLEKLVLDSNIEA